MGDTTQIIVNVVGGAENVRSRIRTMLADYLYSPWGATDDSIGEWLEGSCGAGENLHADIAKYLRSVPGPKRPESISIIEDGKYEWSGEMWRWKPRIGWHVVEVNNDGSVVVNSGTLLDILAKAPDIETARKRVDRVVGLAWSGAGHVTP